MNETTLVESIHDILSNCLHIEIPGPEVDLVESGIMDSLVLVDLIYHLEKRFSVAVPIETLDLDNMRSISAMAALVESLIALRDGAPVERS